MKIIVSAPAIEGVKLEPDRACDLPCFLGPLSKRILAAQRGDLPQGFRITDYVRVLIIF
jgi:hypothetical protein